MAHPMMYSAFPPLAGVLEVALEHTAALAPDPISVATGAFAASGTLGATVIILGVVIAFLWRDAKSERSEAMVKHAELMAKCAELQALRVADALAVQDRMLRVIEQATTVITSVNATMTETRGAIVEVRDSIREHTDELKSFSERIERDRQPSGAPLRPRG